MIEVLRRSGKPCRADVGGFSLVELMIAITLGAIILAAVSMTFVSSKRTYSTQNRLARLQEDARFAVLYLTRDIRMAGYSGCMDDVSNINNTLNVSNFVFDTSVAMEGIEKVSGAGTWYPSGDVSLPANMKEGTDAILIRMADSSGSVSISKPMPNVSAELNVSTAFGLKEDDIIVLSDCASADVMQITAVQTSSNKIQHNAGGSSPGNSTQKLSKSYSPPAAKVMKFVSRLYYVKDAVGAAPPTLYRRDNLGAEQPLVENIEDFQITYGVDTDATDGIPNVYLRAGEAGLQTAAEWARVKSVRFGILVRTPNDKDVDVDIHTDYNINGKTFTVAAGDKFQRRVFTTTVQARNMQ